MAMSEYDLPPNFYDDDGWAPAPHTTNKEEVELPPDFYDDDGWAPPDLDEPSFASPTLLKRSFDEEEAHEVRPAACSRSNLDAAGEAGMELCEDACVPGLCCLAEQGRRVQLSASSGFGSSDLIGCRTPQNANWCDRFEGCKSIFRQEEEETETEATANVSSAVSASAAVEQESASAAREIDTQCNPSNMFSAEDSKAAADRCVDACTPGLCCLADEGQEASFSIPGEAGGKVTLDGCRSHSNEARCVPYLPCSGAFQEITAAGPNDASLSSAAFPTARASWASSSSTMTSNARSTAAGNIESSTPLQTGLSAHPYASGMAVFAFFILLAEAARWKQRRSRAVRLASHRGEYEKVSLLDASQHSTRSLLDSSQHSTRSTSSRRRLDNDDKDDSDAESSDEEEEGGDLEDPMALLTQSGMAEEGHAKDRGNILRNWW